MPTADMGLLTSDKSRVNFLFSFVHKYGNRLSVLLYLSGIVTFAIFISEQWSEKTYFSDNALLPGLVNREFTLSSQAESMLKVLSDETQKSSGKIPFQRIEYEFQRIGLEVYHQNFTLNYPLHNKPVMFCPSRLAVWTNKKENDRFYMGGTFTPFSGLLVRLPLRLWSCRLRFGRTGIHAVPRDHPSP